MLLRCRTVTRPTGSSSGPNMNAGWRAAPCLRVYVLYITISISISSHVSWKKVDQLYAVHFKFHLISSDTKLPKEG